ncbi:TIGR04076 family protein [Candidatus Peregrinibacteria bacterium]|nr:TIGR04076 family protein [Candidatus Peregrinibacteria bacterium]
MFKDLKITCIHVEGKCSRMKVGTVAFVKNAKIELPENNTFCLFALGSIIQPIAAAIIKNKEKEGILDILNEWQCPDPLANVRFKIEEI